MQPHEALHDETHALCCHPSSRPLPTRITPPTYPGHFEERRIRTAGTFRLHNGQQSLTRALNGEIIGLEEVRVGLWNVLYYDTLLGRFDEQSGTITGAPSLKKDCERCPRTKCQLSPRLFIDLPWISPITRPPMPCSTRAQPKSSGNATYGNL